jgi:hypothetical protein
VVGGGVGNVGEKCPGSNLTHLHLALNSEMSGAVAYADDVNILGGSLHTAKENAEALVVATKVIGLEVNTDKTKYMIMSRDQNAGRSHSMKIDNNFLIFHVLNNISLFLFLFLLCDTSYRNIPPSPPRRSEWGSSLPPDCFVSRENISSQGYFLTGVFFFTGRSC